jgi:hypothetical protein
MFTLTIYFIALNVYVEFVLIYRPHPVDTEAKCHLKNLPVKGLSGRCLSGFIYRRYSQSALGTVAPLTFSLVQHPPPFPVLKVQYIRTVCGWEGVGGLSPVGDHILQEFNTLHLTRFRTNKIDRPPQKNLGGKGGLRQINTCLKVHLQVNFSDQDILLWCLCN